MCPILNTCHIKLLVNFLSLQSGTVKPAWTIINGTNLISQMFFSFIVFVKRYLCFFPKMTYDNVFLRVFLLYYLHTCFLLCCALLMLLSEERPESVCRHSWVDPSSLNLPRLLSPLFLVNNNYKMMLAVMM